jgi:hypothetical protein
MEEISFIIIMSTIWYQKWGIASSFNIFGHEQYPFDNIAQNDSAQGFYGFPSATYYNWIGYLQARNFHCFVHYLDSEIFILCTYNCD